MVSQAVIIHWWLTIMFFICFILEKLNCCHTHPTHGLKAVIIEIPSLGGLPPCQQDCCCWNGRLLSSWSQQQEGHVLWHQPVQQPCALLGSPAHHLPLRLWPLRHPAGQLQEEVERPAHLGEEVCVCKWVCESFVRVCVWPQPQQYWPLPTLPPHKRWRH